MSGFVYNKGRAGRKPEAFYYSIIKVCLRQEPRDIEIVRAMVMNYQWFLACWVLVEQPVVA